MNMNAVERVDEYTKLETETTVNGKFESSELKLYKDYINDDLEMALKCLRTRSNFVLFESNWVVTKSNNEYKGSNGQKGKTFWSVKHF